MGSYSRAGGSIPDPLFINDLTVLDDAVVSGDFVASSNTLQTTASGQIGFFETPPAIRGAALPANAADLATAIALVNAIKNRLQANGLCA